MNIILDGKRQNLFAKILVGGNMNLAVRSQLEVGKKAVADKSYPVTSGNSHYDDVGNCLFLFSGEKMKGNKFGILTVKEFSHSKNGRYWRCSCECGNSTTASTSKLKEGSVKSCGCLLAKSRERFAKEKTKHGKTDHKLFPVWIDMIRRCENTNRSDYKNYGGRGISVCREWRESFAKFLKDMGECPAGFTLDRKDNKLGYSKGNCKWSSRAEQNRNTRTSKRWFVRGKEFESSELAGDFFGVNHVTIIRWCKDSQKTDCYSKHLYPVNV